MDTSIRLSSILARNTLNKYKVKPDHSVAHGVRKRLQHSIQNRKSSRLTLLNVHRDLTSPSPCPGPSPAPASARPADVRLAHRLQCLEKWKQEKQQKKRDEASSKKKPFLVGVAHQPLKYEPPPPPHALRVLPSTSGRVTRSRAANAKTAAQPTKSTDRKPVPSTTGRRPVPSNTDRRPVLSFAPKNACFEPKLNNLPRLPFMQPKLNNTVLNKKKVKTHIQPETGQNCRSKAILKSSQVQTSLESRPQSNTRSTHVQTSLRSQSSVSFEHKKKYPTPKKARTTRARARGGGAQTEKREAGGRRVVRGTTSPNSMEDDQTIDHAKRTPKRPIPKSESSSEERLRSPLCAPASAPAPATGTPTRSPAEEHISPNVTCSRGKDNARREFKKKLAEGELDLDAVVESVATFSRQLDAERERLLVAADTWEPHAQDPALPQHAQEAVLAAVGQTRLLAAQKMAQFRSLIGRAERADPGAPLVTRADLQGYWDMMFMQITDVDLRFKKLEELQARGWREATPPPPRPVQRAAPAPRHASRPRPATSRLKDVIAAARRAQRTGVAGAEGSPHPPPFAARSPQWRAVGSPAPTPGTPLHNRSLLQEVLSNAAERSARRSSSSFAMMRASLLARDAQIDGVRPLQRTPDSSPLATPARSILKAPRPTPGPSSPRPRKTVLFLSAWESGPDARQPAAATDENKRPPLRRQSATDDDLTLATPPRPARRSARHVPLTPLHNLPPAGSTLLTPHMSDIKLTETEQSARPRPRARARPTPATTPRRRSARLQSNA